ncbi:two-component system sensor histidine kinase NtrB [Persephonella sp.]
MKKFKKIFKKLSIQWKVAIATSLYILLVLVGAILFTALSFEQKLLKERNQNTVENIKSIIESYKESFILRNLEKIDELVKSIKSIPSVQKVTVYDIDGRIIGDTELLNLGKIDKTSIKIVENAKKPVIKKEKNITRYYYPVKIDEEENIGYVLTVYDFDIIKKNIDREILRIILQTLAIAFIVIGVSAAGTFIISGLMIKPVVSLKEKITGLNLNNINTAINLKKPLLEDSSRECIKSVAQECWLVSQNPENVLDFLGDNTMKECTNCEKFQKLAGDEIEQLSLSFYIMVVSLKDYLRKLDEAHRERETLNCMATMGEMSAKIAHEIKNALYAIGNAANYMKNNIDNELVKEFSEVIREEVNRLNEMTVSFLNFSKLIEPKMEKGYLNEVVKKSVDLLKEDLLYENIDIILDLDENLPEFKFDKNLIKQVIFNLVLNSLDALKETNKHHKYLKISTKYDEKFDKTRSVFLIVEDNGIGIKDEDKDKIFKPFFTTKPDGTGLGLPMVYKIIFSHNGLIYMNSEYGKGTVFTVEFRLN